MILCKCYILLTRADHSLRILVNEKIVIITVAYTFYYNILIVIITVDLTECLTLC